MMQANKSIVVTYMYLKQNTLGAKSGVAKKKQRPKRLISELMWPRFVLQCIMGYTQASLKLQLALTQLRFMN